LCVRSFARAASAIGDPLDPFFDRFILTGVTFVARDNRNKWYHVDSETVERERSYLKCAACLVDPSMCLIQLVFFRSQNNSWLRWLLPY
jgi:hypothetical protein